MASTPDIARETNARFWIMTSYKPGVSLDPADPADKRMSRVWLDVYKDLVRQNARGTISLTHKHHAIAERLNRAIRAYQIESTARQSDPRYAEARAEKAQAINEASMWQDMLTNPSRERITGWGDQPWHIMIGASALTYDLERLHNSFMLLGQEVARKIAVATDFIQQAPEHKQLRENMLAAFKRVETLPLGSQQRISAVNNARSVQEAVADDFNRRATTYPIIEWERTTWQPARMFWLQWRERVNDILRRNPNPDPADAGHLRQGVEELRAWNIKIQNSMPY